MSTEPPLVLPFVTHAYPIAIAAGKVQLSREINSSGVWMDGDGLHGVGRGKSELVPWARLTGLRVIGPRASGRWWGVLQAALETLTPVSMRSRRSRIEWETSRDGWQNLEVDPPGKARFALKDLEALEALFGAVEDSGRLEVLGDAGFIHEALQGLPARTSWLGAITHRRVTPFAEELLVKY